MGGSLNGYKKITGNHPEVLETAFAAGHVPNHKQLVADFIKNADYQKNMEQIFKDIDRSRWLPTNHTTVDQYISDWSNGLSKTYTQGDMTASVYGLTLLLFIQKSRLFIQEGTDRTEENRLQYIQDLRTITFAYYDEEGCLCAVCFNYSKNPALWTVAVLRNTLAAPENRQALFICSKDVVAPETGTTVDGSTAARDFFGTPDSEDDLGFLGSKDAKKLLEGIILEDGTVDFARLATVGHHIETHAIVSGTNQTLVEKKRLFAKLIKEKEGAEKASRQSFVQRHAGNLLLSTVASIVPISLVFILAGVWAPFGFILTASTYLAVGATIITAVAITVSAIGRIRSAESQLRIYYDATRMGFEPTCRAAFLAQDAERVAGIPLVDGPIIEGIQPREVAQLIDEDMGILPGEFEQQLANLQRIVTPPSSLIKQIIKLINSIPRLLIQELYWPIQRAKEPSLILKKGIEFTVAPVGGSEEIGYDNSLHT